MAEKETETPGSDQDKSEKLIGGKFKSAEELAESYQDLERKLTETTEMLSRTERLLALTETDEKTTQYPPQRPQTQNPKTTEDFGLEFEDENDRERWTRALSYIANKIETRVQARVGETVAQMNARRQAEDMFYKRHPDLDAARDLVDDEANRLLPTLRGRSYDAQKVMDEIATRVKERIHGYAKLASKKKEVGHVEGATSGVDHEPPKKEPEPPSEEQQFADYMVERKKEQLKRVNVKGG